VPARLTDRDRIARATPEAAFQSQVITLAKLNGWKVAHFRPVKQQRKDGTTRYLTPVQADGAGFPDLILVRGERLIAAELKREVGKPPTDAQLDWLRAFASAKCEIAVWRPRDWDKLAEALT